MRSQLWLFYYCACICFIPISLKCCAQQHLVYVDLISPGLNSELEKAIAAVGKRDFQNAEAILESMRAANREPKVNLDFVSAVISYEDKDYRTAMTKCFSILEQSPTAIQASDLMCFAAGTQGIPIELQIEALQKSVKCHQDCLLIPPLPSTTNPSDAGVKLANELFIGRPQLRIENDEANAEVKKLLAILLSEGANQIPKRLSLESNFFSNTTHHTYTPEGDCVILYLRPSKNTEYDEVLLFEAFFELLNINSNSQFLSLQRAAYDGSVTEVEFCTQFAKLEFFNVLKTRQFYSERVLPILNRHEIKTNPANWALGKPGQFKAYMARFRTDDWYPWKYYGGFYRVYAKFGYWNIEPRSPSGDTKRSVEPKKLSD